MVCSVASTAAAATLNVLGGQLLGASNVNVGGNFYDVQFLDGTCIALFDGCDSAVDFAFTTQANAQLASQALLDQVFIDGGSGLFDTDPELTSGCGDSVVCRALTPYQVAGSLVTVYRSTNNEVEGSDFATTFLNLSVGQSAGSNQTWALWSVVPEPSTAVLMALGLIGLAARPRCVPEESRPSKRPSFRSS